MQQRPALLSRYKLEQSLSFFPRQNKHGVVVQPWKGQSLLPNVQKFDRHSISSRKQWHAPVGPLLTADASFDSVIGAAVCENPLSPHGLQHTFPHSSDVHEEPACANCRSRSSYGSFSAHGLERIPRQIYSFLLTRYILEEGFVKAKNCLLHALRESQLRLHRQERQDISVKKPFALSTKPGVILFKAPLMNTGEITHAHQ